MAMSTGSEFVDHIRPLGDRLKLYDKTKLSTDQPDNDNAEPTKRIPSGFLDAMTVREEVFVNEQHCSFENELDEDDPRSFHWVAYASMPTKSHPPSDKPTSSARKTSTSTKLPIGTIRLVPPPHAPHPNGSEKTAIHDGKEPYVKLGRLAVIPEFRKAGISRLLIETALAFVRESSQSIIPPFDPTVVEALRQEHSADAEFSGLVLVHAQAGVQKVWRRYGFETDESMGVWDEEGIEHVGMWRRVEIKKQRRGSRMLSS